MSVLNCDDFTSIMLIANAILDRPMFVYDGLVEIIYVLVLPQ